MKPLKRRENPRNPINHLFVNPQQCNRDDELVVRLVVVVVVVDFGSLQRSIVGARTVTARLCIRGHFTKATVRFHRRSPRQPEPFLRLYLFCFCFSPHA